MVNCQIVNKPLVSSLTKSELAQLYFPGAPRSSALRLLHKYITSATDCSLPLSAWDTSVPRAD